MRLGALALALSFVLSPCASVCLSADFDHITAFGSGNGTIDGLEQASISVYLSGTTQATDYAVQFFNPDFTLAHMSAVPNKTRAHVNLAAADQGGVSGDSFATASVNQTSITNFDGGIKVTLRIEAAAGDFQDQHGGSYDHNYSGKSSVDINAGTAVLVSHAFTAVHQGKQKLAWQVTINGTTAHAEHVPGSDQNTINIEDHVSPVIDGLQDGMYVDLSSSIEWLFQTKNDITSKFANEVTIEKNN